MQFSLARLEANQVDSPPYQNGFGDHHHHQHGRNLNATYDTFADDEEYYEEETPYREGRKVPLEERKRMPDQYVVDQVLASEELAQLTPHPQKGVLHHHHKKQQRGIFQYGDDFARNEGNGYEKESQHAVTPLQRGNVIDIDKLLEQFDTNDMRDLEEFDEYHGLSRPQKSKGLLAKYNLPIVKIGQAHSATDTHNKKLKTKTSAQNAQESQPGSAKKVTRERPRWNNFHQNLQSKSSHSQNTQSKGGKESPKRAGEKEKEVEKAKQYVSPRPADRLLVSKPTSEEIQKRKNWKKMRKKLEEERIKLSMKHEVDKRKEADVMSAKKKQQAREASLARQQEIHARIKRIAEEKKNIQMHLIKDLKENALLASSSSKQNKNAAFGRTTKKVLPKLKGANSSAKKSKEHKGVQKKKAAPTKLPKLKSRVPNAPISDTTRANSWKHVRPRIFTNFKAKFVNRSTSPLIFEDEPPEPTETFAGNGEANEAIEVPPAAPEVEPGLQEEDSWKLVCSFHLQSTSVEPLSPLH
ncbi:hypothetical protein HOP50_06g44970 [Chloropicon primus]|uniref:Uncharacterized protein n=1 Tax=Chloropicon primus TaxID=1764295 RepID=A0A5B8MN18_9CHLO|nr:hypothetical protein A3770_06p44740 [Chloropicon primus]UPR01176.1 hypothetical protein HOP50_06g44970 [Chloropicon primus]|mmetsp:Transcript_7788/g.22253  ORF Transcript_7788/g.22253 Transcript_7788/m.22253 type:complete len:525 (+) Transcript_7788:116-1690(+)|eukprot:QDZ21956.1 hypothetical protein A3770_06p44740 [Chloropicon primus]